MNETVNQLFDKFIDRIGFYKTSIFQIHMHLSEFVKLRTSDLPITSDDFVMPILGSKLVYRNLLTGKLEIAYSRFVDVDNVERKTSEIINSYSNFCISQCFEAFETLIKDLIAFYFITDKSFINSDPSYRNAEINLISYESCRKEIWKIAKQKNKYNKQFFLCIYLISERIKILEQDNFIDFDFADWNVVMTEIRHSIVHSDSNFNVEVSANWNDFQKRLLNELFLSNDGYKTDKISTFKHYDYIIEKIAQHGQLIADEIKTTANRVDGSASS